MLDSGVHRGVKVVVVVIVDIDGVVEGGMSE